MINKIKCPKCDKFLELGVRDAFSFAMGESPLVCETHGEVGYRDHDFGINVVIAAPD